MFFGVWTSSFDLHGVSVTERNRWHQLMERRPGMAVCNDTVETNLVQVWCLELQHLVDSSTVDGVGSLADLNISRV